MPHAVATVCVGSVNVGAVIPAPNIIAKFSIAVVALMFVSKIVFQLVDV